MHFILIFLCLQSLGTLPSPTCHFPNLFSSLCAQKRTQAIQKSFKSFHISSTRSSAHTLDPLWLALLLSLALNFNQILCTQLYSCLKPSKVLLLLRKPLPHYPGSWLCCLLPSISPLPIFAPRGSPGTTFWALLSHLPFPPLEWKFTGNTEVTATRICGIWSMTILARAHDVESVPMQQETRQSKWATGGRRRQKLSSRLFW